MIVVDNDLNRKKDDTSKYDNTYNKIIEYLKNIIIDEKVLSNMLDNNEYIIIQETDGENYSINLPNGENIKNDFQSNVAALKTNMVIRTNQDILGIRPGVALRPNYNIHQLIHELLHAISSTQINKFDNDGIAYVKVGTRIDYFDRKLKIYKNPDNLSSDGLNEGITEYLTSVITNEYTGQYPTLLIISKLLMTSNDKLINAYFSNDLDKLEMFYSDLEEKQSIINRNDLINLNSNEMDEEKIAKIIAGAINYNKAYNVELDSESYKWITNYLDNFYMLDEGFGAWENLITKYLNETTITK